MDDERLMTSHALRSAYRLYLVVGDVMEDNDIRRRTYVYTTTHMMRVEKNHARAAVLETLQ